MFSGTVIVDNLLSCLCGYMLCSSNPSNISDLELVHHVLRINPFLLLLPFLEDFNRFYSLKAQNQCDDVSNIIIQS